MIGVNWPGKTDRELDVSWAADTLERTTRTVNHEHCLIVGVVYRILRLPSATPENATEHSTKPEKHAVVSTCRPILDLLFDLSVDGSSRFPF